MPAKAKIQWAPEEPPPSEARSTNATKHSGSGLRRIRWLTEAGGTQVARAEGWSAVVRACWAGGYGAQITTGDRVEFYPASKPAPARRSSARPGFDCAFRRPQIAGGGWRIWGDRPRRREGGSPS